MKHWPQQGLNFAGASSSTTKYCEKLFPSMRREMKYAEKTYRETFVPSLS